MAINDYMPENGDIKI